jgi:DNA-binding NtrC family response regulator
MPSLLILEDDVQLRELLCDALGEEGWDVVPCASYDELLSRAREGTASVAVSDCWGRSQSTLDPLERAQIVELAALVPLVLVTGRTWALGSQREQLGLAAMVGKPFDLDALIETVRSASR